MKRLITLSMLAVCGGAMAQVTYGPGAGGSIPDNTYPGLSSTIVVTGAGTVASFQNVRIFTLTHTWVGDLSARLTGPNGNSVDLFDRMGRTAQSGFGNSGAASSADLTMVDSGGLNLPATLGIGTGTFNIDGNVAGGSSTATHSTLASAFVGSDPNGTWTLLVSDHAGGDLGTFGPNVGWDMTLTPVPEPATMALVAFGLAAAARRRRRGNA